MGEIRGANGVESRPIVHVKFESVRLTDEKFYQLCKDNPKARLELTADGELIALRPTGAKTGARSKKLSRRLKSWSEKDGRGMAFDASTGFTLPERRQALSGCFVARRQALGRIERRRAGRICASLSRFRGGAALAQRPVSNANPP